MIKSTNRRLAQNTVFLYGRMLFTVGLNLYITRLVLRELGEEAYGAYGVVGSLVTIFSIINAGIIATNQRFISFELGKVKGNVHLIFNTLLNITLIFAVIIFAILELFGLWYMREKMNIPPHILPEAIWVFHFSAITSIITLISTPYNALIIAHEKMDVFAYISILQVVLTFVGVWCLRFFVDNKLFLYGLFVMLVSITIRAIYQIYCIRAFKESRHQWIIDKSKLKKICSFTGFSILDGGLSTITWQGIIVIINLFFGVTVNAAYSISNTLRVMILSFAQNVQKAISPQITKTYAERDYEHHNLLVYNGSKAQIFLIFILVIPIIAKTKYVLHLWLGNIPLYTIEFCVLALLMGVLNAGFETIRTSAYATGNINKMVIISNICNLLILPLIYILNKTYNSPIIMMTAIVLADYVVYGIRLYLASQVSVFNLFVFFKKVVAPCVLIGLVAGILIYGIGQFIPDNFLGLVVITIINILLLSILFFFWGITSSERIYIINASRAIINKIR